MLHPLVFALRTGQIIPPFVLFSDRILENPLEINNFSKAGPRYESIGHKFTQTNKDQTGHESLSVFIRVPIKAVKGER
jgi:hypothetical protein